MASYDESQGVLTAVGIIGTGLAFFAGPMAPAFLAVAGLALAGKGIVKAQKTVEEWKSTKTKSREMLIDPSSDDGDHFTFTPHTGNLHATFGKKYKQHNFLETGLAGHALWEDIKDSSGLVKSVHLNSVPTDISPILQRMLKSKGWDEPTPPPVFPGVPKSTFGDFNTWQDNIGGLFEKKKKSSHESMLSTNPLSGLNLNDLTSSSFTEKVKTEDYTFKPFIASSFNPGKIDDEDSSPIELDLNSLNPSMFGRKKKDESFTPECGTIGGLKYKTLPWEKHTDPFFHVKPSDDNSGSTSWDAELARWPSPNNWASPTLGPANDTSYEVMERSKKRTDKMIDEMLARQNAALIPHKDYEAEHYKEVKAWWDKIPTMTTDDMLPKLGEKPSAASSLQPFNWSAWKSDMRSMSSDFRF